MNLFDKLDEFLKAQEKNISEFSHLSYKLEFLENKISDIEKKISDLRNEINTITSNCFAFREKNYELLRSYIDNIGEKISNVEKNTIEKVTGSISSSKYNEKLIFLIIGFFVTVLTSVVTSVIVKLINI